MHKQQKSTTTTPTKHTKITMKMNNKNNNNMEKGAGIKNDDGNFFETSNFLELNAPYG